MSKTLKAILFILAVFVVVGAAYLVGRGSGGGAIEHTAQFSLTVNVSGDFGIVISPTDQECSRGDIVTYGIEIVPSGGFDAPVTLTIGGLPDGCWNLGSIILQPGAYTTTLTIDTGHASIQSNTTYIGSISAHDI